MIRRAARIAALAATAIDGTGAVLAARGADTRVPLAAALLATAVAVVPCVLAFATSAALSVRASGLRPRRTIDTIRPPLGIPRGYVGAGILGGMVALTGMGERYGLYVFGAGVSLIALALSQARPRA